MAPRTDAAFPALCFDQLAQTLQSRARAMKALRWLYASGLPPQLPQRLPGIASDAWARLRAACTLPVHRLVAQRQSADGTVKLALELAGSTVETVLIPGPRRSTVCISSQAGCTRRCAFCATPRLGFSRNLTAAEMVTQYALAQRLAPTGQPARNVVFMGMGEPLDNLDAVVDAVQLLTQTPYPALSPAHVTVSTAGVLPKLGPYLQRCRAQLALSLNATTDEVRSRLMPHNRRWPIRALLDSLRAELGERLLLVEYVLLAGINDTVEDAERLPLLLQGLRARVNLIPLNGDVAGSFRASDDATVRSFQKRLATRGLRCLVRTPRGQDIDAACGQLALRGLAAS